jgi:hypothetical protein
MAVTPPAAHKTMITLATPMDRRSGSANATGLLDISYLPTLIISTVLNPNKNIV